MNKATLSTLVNYVIFLPKIYHQVRLLFALCKLSLINTDSSVVSAFWSTWYCNDETVFFHLQRWKFLTCGTSWGNTCTYLTIVRGTFQVFSICNVHDSGE